MTGIWSSLLVVLILFVGFAIGLLTWSRDLGWVSSIAALAPVLLGLYLVIREYVEDADRAKYRSTPAKLMRDLQLCLEPSFEARPGFHLEYGQRTGIPDLFDPPANDQEGPAEARYFHLALLGSRDHSSYCRDHPLVGSRLNQSRTSAKHNANNRLA